MRLRVRTILSTNASIRVGVETNWRHPMTSRTITTVEFQLRKEVVSWDVSRNFGLSHSERTPQAVSELGAKEAVLSIIKEKNLT